MTAIPPLPRGYKLAEFPVRIGIVRERDMREFLGILNDPSFSRHAAYDTSLAEWVIKEKTYYSAHMACEVAAGRVIIAIPDPAFDWRVDALEYEEARSAFQHIGRGVTYGPQDAVMSMVSTFADEFYGDMAQVAADYEAKLADAEARCERLRKELIWHKKGTVGGSAEEKVAEIERGE